ncbi:MAG TPA: radical SAM protein [Armatimonadota bacterium]|nr:radical SAM protein [Armatimonadota bacterium]
MPNHRARSYRLHAVTQSLCSFCGQRVQAKVIIEDDAVFLLKSCPQHGEHREILEEDAAYYLRRDQYDKPGTISHTQTTVSHGCPYDCGLCPNHEQHTCIGLLEVTSHCDLHCPVCYAHAADGVPLDLPTIERMLDTYQSSEFGDAEILQISGGEPTTHPQILDIIQLAKAKKIRYIMLNTNGLRLADDPNFAKALAQFRPGFEVYLQFDGFDEATYRALRGRDLFAVKQRAIANLEKAEVPITLVTTVQQGVNDHEIGHIVQFGLSSPWVRGVNFQPMALFGRYPEEDRMNRVTLTGVLRRLEQQTHGMVRISDFIPLPCDVDRVAVTYLYRSGEEFLPITRNARIKEYLPLIENTLAFDAGDVLKKLAGSLVCGQPFCQCLSFLKDFLPVAPIGKNLSLKRGKVHYAIENTFRISVTSFIDRYNFELKAQMKECVHVLTPDGRKIPFSAYNMLHREAERVHA